MIIDEIILKKCLAQKQISELILQKEIVGLAK